MNPWGLRPSTIFSSKSTGENYMLFLVFKWIFVGNGKKFIFLPKKIRISVSVTRLWHLVKICQGLKFGNGQVFGWWGLIVYISICSCLKHVSQYRYRCFQTIQMIYYKNSWTKIFFLGRIDFFLEKDPVDIVGQNVAHFQRILVVI